MSVEFSIKPGTATLAKINRDFSKMMIATDRFVRPDPKFRGGIAEVTLDVPVKDFLSYVVAEGFEHHLCMIPGDIAKELRIIAGLLGIKPHEISRAGVIGGRLK